MVIEGKYSKKDLLTEISKKESIAKYKGYYEDLINNTKGGGYKKYTYKGFINWIESQLGDLSSKYFDYVLRIPVKVGIKSLSDEIQYGDIIKLVKLFDGLVKKGKIKNKDIYSKEYEIKELIDVDKI